MNFYLIFFIIIAILVGGFGTYTFFSSGQTIGAIVFLVGALLVFIYYGLRYFSNASPLNPSPVQWPPVINSCPDYLNFFQRTKSDGTKTNTCVDRIGVSKNNSLQVFPADGAVNQDNDAYFFTLQPGADRAALCQQTIQYGLTWEGVTDGESCFSSSGGANAPSGTGGQSGQSGSVCPSA